MPEAFTDENGYASFQFCDAELGTQGFSDAFDRYCLESDYILVAFGDDDLNLLAASWVKRRLDRYQIVRNGRHLPPRKAVINFAVESADLCQSLSYRELTSANDVSESDLTSCVFHPFGSLRERYSYRNISISDLEARAWLVDCTHGDLSGYSDRRAFLLNAYNRHQSIASALHYRYKLISVGAIASLSDLSPKKEDGALDALQEIMRRDPQTKNRILWLEHRRWCAYTRTIGYRCPTVSEFLSYSRIVEKVNGKVRFIHKDDSLRLHPCLLECGRNGCCLNGRDVEDYQIPLSPVSDTEPDLGTWLRSGANRFPAGEYDELDLISLYVSKRLLLAAPHGEKPEEGVRQDFKRYDIEIIKNLYLDERKRLIVRALERGNVPLALHYAERYLDTKLKQKNADLFCVGASERGDFVILLSEEELPPCKVLGAQAEGELPFRIVFFPISKKGKSSRNGTLWDFTSHTLLRAGRKTPDLKEKAEERALKEGKRDRKEDKAGAETPEKNADKTSDIRKENFENKNE